MRNIVVSLFDESGIMVLPWLEAGYECWTVDMAHPFAYDNGGITTAGRLNKLHRDLSTPWMPHFDRDRIAFVAAFPPCDHLAVSGARWFAGKGLRKLSKSIELFATAAEFCEWSGAPYVIENPVSTISTHWRKPDCTMSPHEFTGYFQDDNYTKKTCLWTGGGFVMPQLSRPEWLSPPMTEYTRQHLVRKEVNSGPPRRLVLQLQYFVQTGSG